MDQRQGIRGYVSKKRSYVISALSLLSLLVFLLYAIPKIQLWFAGDEEKGVATGTINSLLGSFSHFFDPPTSDSQKKSSSLLSKPLNVAYKKVENKIVVKKSFKISGEMVEKAVFVVENESGWYRSISFTSLKKNLVCQGSMQENADKFTIFHCSKQKNR